MDNNEKNTQMFMYLVGSFEMSAMMAMGKMKNPVTGTIEKDMAQAQFSIDILDMLTAKTKGNISEYEQKFLENTLGQLKLNYLDEAKKDNDAVKPAKEETKEKKSEDNHSKETPGKSA
jgi:hypothetical protein